LQRIIISVTNDIVNDQRVKKVCSTLQNNFEITLIGRKLPKSIAVKRPYKVIRISLFFNKGFLFYAEFNLRLFFKILFLKKDVLLANDLDTLLPNYLISKIFSKKLVYDSHELFTEVPELSSRPRIRNVWLKIEEFIFPKLKNVYTVNHKIASYYNEKYGVPVNIIRNVSSKLQNQKADNSLSKRIKGDNKMLILQGTGINRDRGAEEAVKMMLYLNETVLYIIGSGDVMSELKDLIRINKLENKVFIKNKISFTDLLEYTKIADLGLNLDKGTNLNYEYSLPNKVFDYIQCQIPILGSNRQVVSDLIVTNDIGIITDTHDPKKLADIVTSVFTDEKRYLRWKKNLIKSAECFTWENESGKLIKNYSNLK
jgi:glycosyltransferase involved in cell wall biosynthesis